MAYLTLVELTGTYYPKAAVMPAADVTLYLQRANTFAVGEIGGQLLDTYVDENLKTAVALAFEILARGETAQVDPVNGNITEAAPAGYFALFQAKKPDPLDAVRGMLAPYKIKYDQLQKPDNNRGFRFL